MLWPARGHLKLTPEVNHRDRISFCFSVSLSVWQLETFWLSWRRASVCVCVCVFCCSSQPHVSHWAGPSQTGAVSSISYLLVGPKGSVSPLFLSRNKVVFLDLWFSTLSLESHGKKKKKKVALPESHLIGSGAFEVQPMLRSTAWSAFPPLALALTSCWLPLVLWLPQNPQFLAALSCLLHCFTLPGLPVSLSCYPAFIQ